MIMKEGGHMYSKECSFDARLLKNSNKKFKIAERAVKMIPKQAVVVLDCGTTVLQIAKLLKLENDLLIITNSLAAAEALENTKNNLLVTGGELCKNGLSFVGNWAAKALQSTKADIAFIGCDGFHEDGPCTKSYKELEIKQSIIKNANEVVLVADSSKFKQEGLYRFATFEAISHIITDSDIDREKIDILPSNIKLTIV